MARVSGLISGLDTDALIQELVAAYETKQQSYEKKQTKLGWKQEAWKSLNTKVYSFYTGALNTARFSSAYSAKKATISDSTKATVSASSDAVEGTQTLKINKLAKTAYLTGGVVNGDGGKKLTADSTIGEVAGLGNLKDASIKVKVNGKETTLDELNSTMTINQFVAELKKAGVNASFDATNQRFFISGKKSGVDGGFDITASDDAGTNALNALGLNVPSTQEAANNGGNSTGGSGAVYVEGTDAQIELNGAVFTSNTNNFSINGLTITATGETAEAITLSTTTDIDGMYDSIKKLISGYNDILKEMNTMYYADSSKGYEPLTDDEKEAMSDDEIEKWEKKIKDSLLRRDDTLGNIMNGMKNVTSKSYEINGKTYSLSTFGIATSGYFSVNNEERGLFHIDGDKDDSTSSGNKDKLRAALATDSGSVIQFFQKLADDLYSDLTNRMKRTSLSSSYTLYNDKQLQKQYEEYDDIIDEWDEKIEKYTEKYVKQFTAMEKAMAQLQSSTSQLTGMLG